MELKFSDLPGQSNIYLDFLYEFENVEKYFSFDVNKIDSIEYNCNKTLAEYNGNREELFDILKAQYEGLQVSALTQKNLSLIKQNNTITITTGQQVGIFTGPLYTIYKAITAIKLADYLKQKYTQFNFVPVFWLAGDDHDFAEIQFVNLLDKEGKLRKIEYDDGKEVDANRGSVGQLKLKPSINQTLDRLFETLNDTEYKEELKGIINKFYNSKETLASAFKKLMHFFFDEFGLIILDPQDPGVKKLMQPIFEKEISNYSEHVDDLIELSAELEEVYHAQVKVKPVNLFMNYEGGRHLIEPKDELFGLKGKRKKFTKEELLELINNSPEEFSPNVLLRPVCQDFILPNLLYVGGPGEIAYYAQLKPLYEFFEMRDPVVYPRASATILEKNAARLIDKIGIELREIFIDPDMLISKIISRLDGNQAEQLFDEANKNFNSIFEEMKNNIAQIDKTLIDSVEKNKQRLFQNLEILKEKVEKAQQNKYQITLNQLNKAKSLVFPNNNLQEREINILYYLNKYGLDFVKFLFSELKVNRFTHQIIEL